VKYDIEVAQNSSRMNKSFYDQFYQTVSYPKQQGVAWPPMVVNQEL
jgi:hypothetical protein